MINKREAQKYLIQCEMLSKWSKHYSNLKTRLISLEKTRFTEAKRLTRLRLTLTKKYIKGTQRGLAYMRGEQLLKDGLVLYNGKLVEPEVTLKLVIDRSL